MIDKLETCIVSNNRTVQYPNVTRIGDVTQARIKYTKARATNRMKHEVQKLVKLALP